MAVVGVLALQGSFNEHIAALRRLGVKGVEIRKPEQLEGVSSLIIPGGESTTMAKLAEYHNLPWRGGFWPPFPAPWKGLLIMAAMVALNGGFLVHLHEPPSAIDNYFPALREFVQLGKPVWGTCAGLIFLANKATGQKAGGQQLIGGLDCTVHRNFFGSQIQSFEAELSVPELACKEGGLETFRGIFIRAPAILEAGPEVQVLADYSVPSSKLLSSDSSIEDQKETADGESKVIVAVRQGSILGTAFHPELTADTRWHSYFVKMANAKIGEEASSSLVPAQDNLNYNQQPRNDLPIFQ